jgi:hypothetical protein
VGAEVNAIFPRQLWPKEGRAITQAVSRWLPTATARVRDRAQYVRFVGRAIAQAVSRWFPTAPARVRDLAEYVRFVVDYFFFFAQETSLLAVMEYAVENVRAIKH